MKDPNKLKQKLRISNKNLNEINNFLLQEDNVLINDLLELVDKYGGVDEIYKVTFIPSQCIILSQLIVYGGKTDKREFYKDKIKDFDLDSLDIDKQRTSDDLERLGYQHNQVNNILEALDWFYEQKVSKLQLSSESYFNLILSSLNDFCPHFPIFHYILPP